MPINSKIPDYSDDFDFESRITGAEFSAEDIENEFSLRPKTLNEYVGQQKVKDNLDRKSVGRERVLRLV
jgi:hypothetical protein